MIDEALRLRKQKVFDCVPYNLKMLGMVAERAEEFDVIHNHHDYWMLPLSRMVRTPLLTTLHGRLDLPDIASAFLSYPEASYVSISDSQRRPMPGLKWAATIRHGLDIEALRFEKKPGKYLAFLGRIGPEKRPEWAIEMARLAGVPLKIAAKIEGKEGQDYYDAFVRPHVDGRQIEYVGEISEGEKSEFLGGAFALAFPIDWPEPFGLVMVEALACGTPVLARPCGAAGEILRDGVTGFLDLDIRQLARRVADLPSIDRLGCRRWAETRFSLQRMIEDYIHVYRNLSDSDRARSQSRAPRHGSYHHRWNLLHPFQRLADGNS